jgi:hypothetical protein
MNEHLFPYDSFIGGWYMPEKVCDNVIQHYKVNSNRQFNGIVGGGDKIEKDKLDDTRITMSESEMIKYLPDYNYHLVLCLNNFKSRYIDFERVAPYGINENINIQYYKPGGGYKVSHFENNGSKLTGKRYLTFMTYLNNVPDGGTEFKYQQLITPAVKGLTIIWPAYPTHLHKGQISMTNEKYIITGWFTFDE